MPINVDELTLLRSDLTRFAFLILRDVHTAEDIVQETMLIAIEKQDGFKNKSSLKTWLFAILRNKSLDKLKQGKRVINIADLSNENDDALEESLFNQKGRWNLEAQPTSWGNPEDSFEQTEFWRIFEACLHNLPEKTSRIFMMREFLELEVEDICKETKISTSNCWVTLHRARAKLRLCLDTKWFSGQGYQEPRI